ncbi:MAG: hypothetical protein WBI11_06030, partial [Schleiferiaceae bacterium]
MARLRSTCARTAGGNASKLISASLVVVAGLDDGAEEAGTGTLGEGVVDSLGRSGVEVGTAGASGIAGTSGATPTDSSEG